MLRYTLLVVGVGWLLTSTVVAQQLPPGYQGVIQITNDDAYNGRPSINNHGQIVFAKYSDPYNTQTGEIYLYEDGVLTRLTEDNIQDGFPEINDAGEMAWTRAMGGRGAFEIVLYRDGVLTRLTFDDLSDSSPQINNTGLIAWNKFTDQGCGGSEADIYLYDGETIQCITFGGYSNQGERLNDLGDIVWSQKNFCNYPWTSQIMMYSAGVITPLTDDQGEPQCVDINNDGLVAWQHSESPEWNHHIRMWEQGVTSVLTDWGSGLRLNNRGDVVFNRWHEDSSTWQVWLYINRTGEFWQLTDDPFWNCSGDINDYGDIAWQAGSFPDTDIKLLKRFPAGDLNCDGAVNAFDIDPFVLALTDPPVYELTFPGCDYLLADLNLDGAIDAFDIDPFVEVLTP